METPHKFIIANLLFIIAIINLRDVSTKLNKYIVFTMQTYKKLNMIHLSLSKCVYSYAYVVLCVVCVILVLMVALYTVSLLIHLF